MTRPVDPTETPEGPVDSLAALRLALTRPRLATLAGATTFRRGEDYAAEGRVGLIDATPDGVQGVVQGERRYRVWVGALGDDVLGRCDCPMGEDGRCCKHQVALALAWLEEQRPGTGRTRSVSMQEVREFLLGLEPATLVSIIPAEADRDDAFSQRLLARTAAAAAGADHDQTSVRRAIDQAVRNAGYVRYQEAWDYVAGIMNAVDLIDDVRLGGDPAAAIGLAENALVRVEEAMGDVDDSDGGMGEVLARLQGIHLAACEAARPDPVALARTLFEWELHGEWDVFAGAVERYRDVLGEVGLAAYRRLAESAWEGVPAVGPGERTGSDPYLRITSIMESLARTSGDTDALISVMRRDLAYPYDFLAIAQVCRELSRYDEALDWAERGITDFPGRADQRIRDFLIEEYMRRGRTDDAITQAWAAFTEGPSLGRHQALRTLVPEAGEAGAAAWSAWRDRAVEHVRLTVLGARKARPQGARPSWQFGPDGSVAVQIHLAEGDLEAAWGAAQELDCSRRLWLDLARQRAAEHPADAIAVYQREIEAAIGVAGGKGYATAVELVGRVAAIMERQGEFDELSMYLVELRARHGRKRNLIKLLDGLEHRRVSQPGVARLPGSG